MSSEERRKAELESISKRFAVEGATTEDDYDPHDYRKTPYGTTYIEALGHVLNGSVGTGILAMPEAFKHAGWANSLIFTVIIAFLCAHGIHLLIGAQYTLCKRLKVPYLSYPLAMKASLLSGPLPFSRFATASHFAVDFFLIVYQTGICCVYVIFVAENLQQIFEDYLTRRPRLEFYILIMVVPFLLLVFIPNLKWLAPFSILSNVLTLGTGVIVLYYVFTDLKPIKNLRPFGRQRDYPLFVGTMLFAIAALGVITFVERTMADPKKFSARFGVLNMSMIILAPSYALFGFFGYWAYQDQVQPSVTLNLPKDSIAAKVCQALYIAAIYVSYGLNSYIPVDIIWNTYVKHHFEEGKCSLVWHYLIRITLGCITLILAATVPLLSSFISLSGAFCMSTLEIIFPAIMDVCVKWPDGLGTGNWVLVKNIIIVILGFVGMFSGTYSSIRDIADSITAAHENMSWSCLKPKL